MLSIGVLLDHMLTIIAQKKHYKQHDDQELP